MLDYPNGDKDTAFFAHNDTSQKLCWRNIFFKIGISAYMPTRFCHSAPMVIAFLALSSLHDAYTMPTQAYTILRLYSVLTRIY